ncbi:MAG: efflux RND transporter periplasmic adaptor subunit [Nitrospirota bacterium]
MRKKVLYLIILILLVAVAFYVIFPHLNPKNNYLTVSGRVEASEIELAARIPGKLESVLIEDGVNVKKGDTVALIEDKELQSKRREIIKGIEELSEKINATEFDLEYIANNVKHAIDEARKTLSVANARFKQAEAQRENAEKEFKRYSNLLEKEVVSKQKYDREKLASEFSKEEVNVALKEIERANVALMKAEDSKALVMAKEKELLALRKSLSQLKETLHQMEINIGYTKIVAPLDGIILRKVAEPGEVVHQGGVVGVMINPADIYAKTYVPEKYIGKIQINMKAEVLTDSYPEHPFTGYVCYISDKAEFTPKEVQSYEERVKQVFASKICFSKGDKSADKGKTYQEVLKKGMPVDVRFDVGH